MSIVKKIATPAPWIVCCLFFALAMSEKELKKKDGFKTYWKMCDGSASVRIDETTVVIASDEDNILRFFRLNDSIYPVSHLDISSQLELLPGKLETDIEGAARLGDIVYFLTSHGRDKNGKIAPNRQRFFAMQIDRSGKRTWLDAFGNPYKNLLGDIVNTPSVGRFFNESIGGNGPDDEYLRPKSGGINIEALSADADGKSLLIGFRSPLFEGRAIVLRLSNPLEVVTLARPALFDDPVFLDLAGLAIRSMEYIESKKNYYIVAGSSGPNGTFALYSWDGEQKPVRLHLWNDDSFHPETLIESTCGEGVDIFSDEGSTMFGNDRCKDLEINQRRFLHQFIRF